MSDLTMRDLARMKCEQVGHQEGCAGDGEPEYDDDGHVEWVVLPTLCHRCGHRGSQRVRPMLWMPYRDESGTITGLVWGGPHSR